MSHQPVLSALLSKRRFSYVMELGVGMDSTPLFAATDARMLCVENDAEWLRRVQAVLTNRPATEFRYHPLGAEVQLGTPVHQLSDTRRSELHRYYEGLARDVPQSDGCLLFVDQFRCCRAISLEVMLALGCFEAVIYHDCQPAGVEWYGYAFQEAVFSRYLHFIYRTPVVWTGLFLQKSSSLCGLELEREIMRLSRDFAQEHGLDLSEFRFERVR